VSVNVARVEVVRIGRDRLGDASDVLARAFLHDPAWVWLIPDADKRERLLPWLFRVGFDVTAADVYATAEPVVGAARWLPPGRPPMRIAATLKALASTPFKLGTATAQFLAYGRAVEQMRADTVSGPHWYLAGIGVDPSAQRQGVGAALLQPGLRAAASAGLPAVLLTNNEANLHFYESHGFVVERQGHTPQDGPRAWAMVKPS
jgi:ribosomal protein S18 acetylase RimI-like enzyme